MPALKEAADGSLNNLRNQRKTFGEQMQRLLSVLETKRKIACGLYDEVDVNVEDGSPHPHCGTMDASQTLRGVDCTVGKTDTGTRTILCEAGRNLLNFQPATVTTQPRTDHGPGG